MIVESIADQRVLARRSWRALDEEDSNDRHPFDPDRRRPRRTHREVHTSTHVIHTDATTEVHHDGHDDWYLMHLVALAAVVARCGAHHGAGHTVAAVRRCATISVSRTESLLLA